MIAEIIVDVAAHPIDRPFDYSIPAHLQVLAEPGMRVKVPFGNRKVLGFITAVKDTTDFDPSRLKPIHELMDVVPVLNKELLDMAKWMKKETVCFERRTDRSTDEWDFFFFGNCGVYDSGAGCF